MSRAATQPGRAPPPRLERKAARERTRTGCRVALRPIVFVARPMTDVVRPITDVVPGPITDVAVGVVFDATGRVLVGQRVAGKPYGGWWEFPGGKFEPGENAHAALVRELDEELGISVERSDPWLVREHVYEHAHVRLHFRHVVSWQGQARGREGQALVWRDPAAIDVAPLLPAASVIQ